MDAKRRPPPIPEKTVAAMPPAKASPVPGPPPPTQLESAGGHAAVARKDADGDGGVAARGGVARGAASSNSDATDIIQADGGANERFDPPVGGQFTSPAVAIMDPMKKARRKAAHPAYVNQQQQQQQLQQQQQQQPLQQPGFQRAISPSQLPALPFGPAGGGGGPPARPMTNSVCPPAKGTISASSSNGFHAAPDGLPHQVVQNQTAAIQQQTAQKQLRSPTVKRAPGASVTMQGWLHKQGSDGLMLWKRRWFVLSEFCLFYYKGPEEEKVLGSILLPSYVISPCTSDERKRGGNRKHSFKAEHHNMRTYYFAADTLELMERWMHAMNLASFLQKEFTATAPHTERVSWDERQSGRPSVSSYNSLLNQSADDSDSGFHGCRSPKHATIAVGSAAIPGQALSVPTWAPKGMKIDEETISDTSREREMALACRKGPSPEVPSLPGEFQPLYANAPPKPRRLNSGGRDYSTSPERSPERKANEEGGVVMRSRLPQNEPLMPNGMYVERGERASRPMVAFASIRHERNVTYQHQPVQPGQHPMIVPPPTQMIFTGVDRRTPDTYGRSNTAEVPAPNVAKMAQNRVDYEDVYNVSHNSDALGRVNRWSSGPYDLQHYVPNDIHQNAIQPPPPPVPTHVHHCPPPPSGHSPQQAHLLHPHGQQQLGMMPRMPLSHPYSVSPTTAQHQHPPPVHQYPNQLLPPQPQPQVVQRRTPPLPRPHSADFLGHYEQNQFTYVLPLSPNVGSVTPSIEQSSPKMPSTSVDELHKQQPNAQVIEVREQHTVDIYHGQPVPRPKSSMDIRPYNQGRTFDPADYWSEESYARMMRQSLYLHAQHVHPSSSSSHKGSETSSGLGVPQQPSWPAQPQEPPAPAPSQPSQSRSPQSGQKQQQTSDALEVWGKTSEDAEAAASSRQSGKRDLHQAGHFLRSASARMPRSRYNSEESAKEPSSAMSAVSGEEVRYGERKMQQREESMRRLLEWKQRMLQSPLTRKTSSSSGPRKSNQDISSYNSSQMGSSHYKQMVLKQLASQEAAASANNWEHVSRRSSSRRGPDDVRTTRSRSHDGRRSSASLSRYNSYSSDDEGHLKTFLGDPYATLFDSFRTLYIASGTGSIRESAPVRHPKNDPASTMLIISQPTSMPTSSPAFVQPRVAANPQPKQQHQHPQQQPPQQQQQHGVPAQNGGVDVDGHMVGGHVVGGMAAGEAGGMDGGTSRRWRGGGEGPVVVGKAMPMLRWDKENTVDTTTMRRPQPEQPSHTQEGDFLTLQRQSGSSPMRHEASNGGGIRGRVGRESGDAVQGSKERNRVDRGGGGGPGGRAEVSVSAGDLLGRTHEELVLLLIQLRRQSAAVSNAIDLCQADLRAQARLAELEMHRRVEHLKKLEELKKHLLELEKQYEKGKPLINLVDNMVKLGSLYRGNTDAQGQVRSWRGTGGEVITGPSPAKDRLQFNQRVQEQRLLAEERRDWSRLSPDHGELQAKVQQLYRLDRLLQEESVTIQSLQQDKELLEKALGGLRHKLQGSTMSSSGNHTGTSPRDMGASKGGASAATVDPVEAERYRKQQRMLERELSRVRQLLAQNSKKLEETVAENARLEQELVVLRQKLQLSRRTVDNQGTSPSPASSSMTNPASPTGATASLEAELRRVQSAVGDLQRQRHELSVQVRQLTEKSHSLVEQIRPGPTGVAGAGPIPAKKRHHSTWMETDLDSMESVDCGIESPGQGLSPSRGLPMIQTFVHTPMESTPLYVNTTLGQHPDRDDFGRRVSEDPQSMANGYEMADGDALDEAQGYQAMDISEADDRMKRFYGIIPREKTEIKTVRIVKRESERRHRDRSSKRVVLVEDTAEGGGATSPSSSSALNRVLEEEPAEGDEGEGEETEGVPEGAAAMAAYHSPHHHLMQTASAATTPVASTSSVPYSSGFLTSPEDDPILSQFFQRSMSLPRVLGKQPRGHQPSSIPPPPPLRVASPRGSSAAVRRQQILQQRRSDVRERPRSAHEQLFGATSPDDSPIPQTQHHLPNHHLNNLAYPLYSPSSPSSHCSASPTNPLYPQPQPGTVPVSDRAYPPPPPTPDSPPLIAYKSEAAREIALEMAAAALHSGSEDWANGGGRGRVKKRATPKEKRRHYTVSCSRPLELESIVIPKMGSARSRDDLDMEQVLRPRLNAPDVVRSTMSHRDFKYNEHTIDSVLGTPNKIVIPERYIPEQAPELSEEEQMQRLKKAEAIRKMLSETTPISAPEVEDTQQKKTSVIKKKVAEEKRQRDHILQLNQILAKQVMEKSKMVAVRALATLPLHETSTDDDDLSSPVQPLPLTQQRDNFFS
ncbi:uncharacterized protein LOC124162285 isoform X3 [Ischnura elegans]|uniref:uncharacterized protein LOC124162285 isoform X3 n=1 Tax=Ischnura elegans TaxID=197161 RepID=UPI001ED87D89|nr:uncharacterized protein LOC124162285 isoform X3 [Ischnura elegans]